MGLANSVMLRCNWCGAPVTQRRSRYPECDSCESLRRIIEAKQTEVEAILKQIQIEQWIDQQAEEGAG